MAVLFMSLFEDGAKEQTGAAIVAFIILMLGDAIYYFVLMQTKILENLMNKTKEQMVQMDIIKLAVGVAVGNLLLGSVLSTVISAEALAGNKDLSAPAAFGAYLGFVISVWHNGMMMGFNPKWTIIYALIDTVKGFMLIMIAAIVAASVLYNELGL